MSRIGRPATYQWTPDADRQLIELRENGVRLDDIVEVLGRSKSAVSRRITALNLPRKPRGRPTSSGWGANDDAALISHLRRNTNVTDIAKHMRRSHNTITRRAAELGWNRVDDQWHPPARDDVQHRATSLPWRLQQ